jgi:uncharacterized protein YbaR (Trm112 family)
VHIELTEMLRCPEAHREEMLVLSTGEVKDRMIRSGLVGCPVCHAEYPIARGIVNFRRSKERAPKGYTPPSPLPAADAVHLQALLELSGPGGYVVLVGAAVRQAPRLSSLMEGIHFVGINPPPDMEEQPTLSLIYANEKIPLRTAVARGVVVGADLATSPWLVEAHRALLRGRRFVVENEEPELPIGLVKLAAEHGLWVGEKR